MDRDFSGITDEDIVQLRRATGSRERQRVIISGAHSCKFVLVAGIASGGAEESERLQGRVLRDQEHQSSGVFLRGAADRAAIGLVHDRDRSWPDERSISAVVRPASPKRTVAM